jgi:hypothetical protein
MSTDLLDGFPVNAIDHIEVIKGPGSVLYGSNAFAGVVNIITIKPSGNHAHVSVMGAESRGKGGYGATQVTTCISVSQTTSRLSRCSPSGTRAEARSRTCRIQLRRLLMGLVVIPKRLPSGSRNPSPRKRPLPSWVEMRVCRLA